MPKKQSSTPNNHKVFGRKIYNPGTSLERESISDEDDLVNESNFFSNIIFLKGLLPSRKPTLSKDGWKGPYTATA